MLTLQQPSSTPTAIIKRWEDARDQLAQSFSAYLDSCLALDTCSRTDFTSSDQLVSKIDHNLDLLSTQIKPQLIQSQAALSHMRNKLMCGLCCFPEEILTSIFWHFVGDYEDTPPRSYRFLDIDSYVPGQVESYYCRLRSIGAVCSVWRKLIFSTGAFWSLIPFICLPERSNTFVPSHEFIQELLMIRSQGSKLHLVVHSGTDLKIAIPPTLSHYASRISSINIACDLNDIEEVLQNLLQADQLDHLTDLSVSFHDQWNRSSRGSNKSLGLNQLILKLSYSLRVLRIGALDSDFDFESNLRFNRLAELRIQAVTLGSTSFTQGFLAIAAAAPSLRILRFITVTTVNSPTLMIDYTSDRSSTYNAISLPNLDVLYLDDLPLELTNFLIHSIVPGSHHITICMRERNNYLPTPEDENVETYPNLFHGVEIETLHLDKRIASFYGYDLADITCILRSMNLLKELQLDSWPDWSIFVPQPGSPDSEIFTFKRLYMTGCSFSDTSKLKEVITSCPVQELTISACINGELIQETDEIVAWLRGTVPRVSLIPFYKCAPEFQTPYWWL